MNIDARLADIRHTLNCITDEGAPVEYYNNPLATLITVTDSVATLCWNIETASQLPSSPHPDSLCAQDIYTEANKIAGICLTELDNMHKGIANAGVTIVSDCAELNLHSGYPLDSLDISVNPAERIKRLIEAVGEAAPYWVHTTDINDTERAYREENIATLAWHATSAIIATNRQLIAG